MFAMFRNLADWVVEILGIAENPDRCNRCTGSNEKPEEVSAPEKEKEA